MQAVSNDVYDCAAARFFEPVVDLRNRKIARSTDIPRQPAGDSR
jgi:hypothetical protein